MADKAELAEKYRHIMGWGMDYDEKNDPAYPVKRWNGADHKRLHYARPPLQPLKMEVLRSTERSDYPAVFGETIPPKGLSGMIRRAAFMLDENQWRHWFGLLLADRINIVEGLAEDLAHGYIPNILKETGFAAAWKYNRRQVLTRMLICTAAAASIAALIYFSRGNKEKSNNSAEINI
jgi:hypothetical protein